MAFSTFSSHFGCFIVYRVKTKQRTDFFFLPPCTTYIILIKLDYLITGSSPNQSYCRLLGLELRRMGTSCGISQHWGFTYTNQLRIQSCILPHGQSQKIHSGKTNGILEYFHRKILVTSLHKLRYWRRKQNIFLVVVDLLGHNNQQRSNKFFVTPLPK